MRPTRLVLLGQPVDLVAPAPPHPDEPLPQLQQMLPWRGEHAGLDDSEQTPRQERRDASADQRQRAAHLVAGVARATLEALQHQRPAQQLAASMSEPAHQVLLAWSRHRSWQATRIVAVRATRVGLRAVEGTVHLYDTGLDRHFSAVLRLEHGYGRWTVTVFEVLLPPAALRRAG